MVVNTCEFIINNTATETKNLGNVPIVNDMVIYGKLLYLVVDRCYNLDTSIWSIYLEEPNEQKQEEK